MAFASLHASFYSLLLAEQVYSEDWLKFCLAFQVNLVALDVVLKVWLEFEVEFL